MRLFLDTEFTSLSQRSQLISLALVGENGDSFYAEFDDYDTENLSDWHQKNVIANLSFLDRSKFIDRDNNSVNMKGNSAEVKSQLELFLKRDEQIEMWGDNHAYDWVLFCELWGGALGIPKNIDYLVRDLATLFLLKGMSPDQDRLEYAFEEKSINYKEHNALVDARAAKCCFEKLLKR